MSNKKKYNTKSVKEMLLMRVGEAYYALGSLGSEETKQEEKLINYALFKVLEKDMGMEKQFIELLGLSYMLQGIADNLRLLADEQTEVAANENEQLF